MDIYQTRLKSGITRTPEFERKGLAEFAVNVGTKCGHGCTYCSSGALLRCHPSFQAVGRSPFDDNFAIVDPDTPERVARAARRMRRRGMIQLCTTVDAWSPEAQQHDLGRRCLEAILAEPGWTVRILTKSAVVARDFNVIERFRDRVLVGVSLTAAPDEAAAAAILEPRASSIAERVAVLQEAHRRGLRTYGMLCPLLPGIADRPAQIEELVRLVAECGAEEIFVEPVNARGPGLARTQEALAQQGFDREADAIGRIRRATAWSTYVVGLLENVQGSMRANSDIHQLRFLLYPSRILPAPLVRIRADDAGVIWLGRDDRRTRSGDHAP